MLATQEQRTLQRGKRTCSPSRADLHVKSNIQPAQSSRNEGTIQYPRDARKAQIEEQVALHQSIHQKPLTMRQIAKRVHMSPGGHLMDILWEMTDEQRLVPAPRAYRETMTAWDFKLPPDRVSLVLERIYQVQ